MILTNEEMDRIRQSIEAQAGLDDELLRRCGPLIHMGKFDEAVRSAFVLLEERLRKAVDKEGMTGSQLANYAFSPDKGPLAKHLGQSQSEREGLRELYSGAFKLFRNPTAHSVVDYSVAEGKAIIGLVNLMLRILERDIPSPLLIPENVEKALGNIEQGIGPGAASRTRWFVGKCIEAGIRPTSAKYGIPFKRYAFVKYEHWDNPKPYRIAMFYLSVEGLTINFPVSGYYAYVIGFDADRLVEEATELGFQPTGKRRDPTIDLRVRNDQKFFKALFDLVMRTADELEETLQQE